MSVGGSPVRVPLLHLRIGVMNEMQYRANFFIQLLESVVLTGTGLIALSLIFDHTTDLDGWTRSQLLIVLGVYTVVGGVIQFVIQPNMSRILSEIRLGTFDYVLTKPVDSQLLATLPRVPPVAPHRRADRHRCHRVGCGVARRTGVDR